MRHVVWIEAARPIEVLIETTEATSLVRLSLITFEKRDADTVCILLNPAEAARFANALALAAAFPEGLSGDEERGPS